MRGKNRFFIIGLIILLTLFYIKFSSKNKIEKKGDILFSQGKIEEAIEFWKSYVKENRDSKIYEKIVMGYILEGKLDEAENWAKEGLTYFPGCVNLIYNLALINFYKKNYELSLELIDRVLEMNRYFPNAHYLKGLIFEIKGDIEKAKREFVEDLNITPWSRKTWEKLQEIEEGENERN